MQRTLLNARGSSQVHLSRGSHGSSWSDRTYQCSPTSSMMSVAGWRLSEFPAQIGHGPFSYRHGLQKACRDSQTNTLSSRVVLQAVDIRDKSNKSSVGAEEVRAVPPSEPASLCGARMRGLTRTQEMLWELPQESARIDPHAEASLEGGSAGGIEKTLLFSSLVPTCTRLPALAANREPMSVTPVVNRYDGKPGMIDGQPINTRSIHAGLPLTPDTISRTARVLARSGLKQSTTHLRVELASFGVCLAVAIVGSSNMRAFRLVVSSTGAVNRHSIHCAIIACLDRLGCL